MTKIKDIIKVKKLEGLPRIYYLNYDEHEERKEYIEKQFEEYEIKNYERISKSKYSPVEYNKWKNLIIDIEKFEIFHTPVELSSTLNHLQTIIDWYDNESDETCIIMEDTISFDVSKYWMFDWKTLIKNLPYNWDCIQLFTVGPQLIPMHLKPKEGLSRSVSCYMITRHFAKKLKQNHYIDGKYKILVNTKNCKIPEYETGNLDFFLYELGLTYTLPVFQLNEEMIKDVDWPGSYEDAIKMRDEDMLKNVLQKLSSQAIEYWWRVKSKTYSTNEFFSYNKNYDWRMEVEFDVKKQEVFMDRDSKIMLWI